MLLIKWLRIFLTTFFIRPFGLFFSSIGQRWEFEEKNWSFTPKFSGAADFCFEVSSEGELEQVRPLIEHLLHLGKKIELLYCSPSVEKNVKLLSGKYQDSLHTLRVPLLHQGLSTFPQFDIHRWITASHLILCRYDFFPEFLEWANVPGRKLGLMAATSLNLEKKLKHPLWGSYNRKFWTRFDWIVPSTEVDERELEKFFPGKVFTAFDFRILGITERQKNSWKTLMSKFPQFSSFHFILKNIPLEKRAIIGSAWNQDLAAFENLGLGNAIKSGEFFVVVAPHDIGPESAQYLAMKFPDLPLYEWNAMMTPAQAEGLVSSFMQRPGVILLNIKGVLCELYPLFSQVLLGGGFTKSVHSVFEPFLANCMVATGPMVQRSTEVLFVKNFDQSRIEQLETPTQWFPVMAKGQRHNVEAIEQLVAKFTIEENKLLLKMEEFNAQKKL